MSYLSVKLPRDRDRCGTLTLYDGRARRICGPFAVAGRASDTLAAANGNTLRNPLLRFGDTPSGSYRVREILGSGRGTLFDAAQFGPHGIVALEGVSGDAALAEANGRFHILIVGGKRSSEGNLRSTAGSLRLSDEHQKALIAALRELHDVSCDVDEDPSIKSRQRVFIDPACQHQDPHNLHVKRASTASRSINRELLLGGAAGAMMSVAFVALPSTPARASESPAPQSSQHVRDEVKFLPPTSLTHHGYVQLAYGGAMQQLENAQHQTTGKTFDNSNNPQPSDATPGGTVNAPVVAPSTSTTTTTPTPPPSTGNAQVDQVIQQQQQINAIRSEKPPPNATQEQLNQWQQNQQQRIQNVTNPPPAQTPPKSDKVILDKGAAPSSSNGSSKTSNGSSQ
jgi:hypothetical protein